MITKLPAFILAWAVLVPMALPLIALVDRTGRRPALTPFPATFYGD